ncbi:MAG: hypothetical protein PHP08_03660, partial [Candidatus Dojkabacteria bacterium]|nr:hypothetical protein [Candidatus Dojkabacteria bacterium]
MNKKKFSYKELLIEIPSIIFSSPIITTVLTVVIARYLPYIGLIISSVFFYIVMPILLYFYLYKKGL